MIKLHKTKTRSRRKPVALVVAAHPIWNVPPFINASKELARHGYRVLVVGYQAEHHPHTERLAAGASIFRLKLASRRIRWTGLRKFLAVLEFLGRCWTIVRRVKPDVLITFNDPACILQKLTRSRPGFSRVNWLLEYPELERLSFVQRRLIHWSATCWKEAETVVVPTRERLALHLALRPDFASRRTLVVQNAPLDEPVAETKLSERTRQALAYLNGCEPGTIRIIYSGAIGNRYGADALIRAVGSFPRGVRLLILGKKHPLAEAEVADALKETAFPDNVSWIDEIPYRDLSHVLRCCDAGFGTYRGDTLNTRFSAPGKLYEYLKSGLVILSDEQCCIYAEVTAAGCGAFFPKPVEESGIHRALTGLLESPEKIPEMKAAARRLFEKQLCMEQQIKPLLRELDQKVQLQSIPERQAAREPVRV